MTRRRIAPLLVVVLLVATALPLAGRQGEAILSYDVVIEVGADARLDVTETIRVRALGQNIRRGIYRDFPTTFPRVAGLGRIEAPFDVVEVTRDGRSEPYTVSSIGESWGRGGVRVRIGDPDVRLDPAEYTYTIRYITERWIRFGEEEDEIYWNVTGNAWAFPIQAATALITLPSVEPPLEPTALEVWTGPEGSTATDAQADWAPEDRGARFATTRALGVREGMTVRVTVPTGWIAGPSDAQRAAWFWLDWSGYIDGAIVVLLITMVYLAMWMRVGRDPSARPVTVRYEPPAGFSPAALGFIRDRGFAHPQFAATLVSLAIAGLVDIEQEKKKWKVHRVATRPGPAEEEMALFDALLNHQKTVSLESSNHRLIADARKRLKIALTRRFEHDYFINNRRWFLLGAAVSLFGFAALAWRARYGIEPAAWVAGFCLSIWTAAVGTMLFRAGSDLIAGVRARSGLRFLSGLVLAVSTLPFVAAEGALGYFFVGMVPTHLVLAALSIGATNVLFYHLLERPTLRGRGLLDELAGFERFLEAAERDRLDRLTGPDRTPELFERYLPYAIALGLENEWARGFEFALAPANPSAPSSGGASFSWYRGTGAALSASALSGAVGSAFSSSLSSASSAPSSGRGGGGGSSSGGGSSGGGGGGGGGGGW